MKNCEHKTTKIIYDDVIVGIHGMLVAPKTDYEHYKLLVCKDCKLILRKKKFINGQWVEQKTK